MEAMIAILGSNGMLGSMVAKAWDNNFRAFDHEEFDAENPDLEVLEEYNWIINCIGLIKPYCDDVERAIRVNSLFPYQLPPNTIQIATDCVFSGKKGNYVETDLHDAIDVYGKTKSLGEANHIKNLRCSIIGPEVKNHISLLDWALSQDKVKGYVNHQWNGITTYHFARICQGIIQEGIELPHIQHIVPSDSFNKAELLRTIARVYKRDIEIIDTFAPEDIDRRLSTNNPEMNLRLWKAAGYNQPPTIEQMIMELSEL